MILEVFATYSSNFFINHKVKKQAGTCRCENSEDKACHHVAQRCDHEQRWPRRVHTFAQRWGHVLVHQQRSPNQRVANNEKPTNHINGPQNTCENDKALRMTQHNAKRHTSTSAEASA